MSEERKQLSLADLGVEEVKTPAEMAADENNISEENKVETVGTEETVSKKKKERTSNIVTPRTAGTVSKNSNVITNVNDIAEKPITVEKNPVRKTLDNLYELADQNIERTKKEIQPRIDSAKQQYIDQKWTLLESRAKKNSKLAQKIKEVNDRIDTDATFDGIDDYLRHGYILTVVAHDMGTGIDDKFFGIENNAQPQKRFRNSKDAADDIEKVTSDNGDKVDIYDDNDTLSLNKSNAALPYKEEKTKEPPVKEELLTEENPVLEDYLEEDMEDDSEDTKTSNSTDNEIHMDEAVSDDDDDDTIDEETQKKIIAKYKNDIEQELNMNDSLDLEGFSISNKSIKLSAAVSNMPVRNTTLWGLQYSGTPVEITPFSGEDLITLNPRQTDYTTIAGLRTVFSTLYRHIANNNKPQFEDWLHQISDSDVDCLLFGVYVANFKDTNILTHECDNPKCGNVFIKKYKIDDLINYPNDNVKQRFDDILHKDTTMTSLYRTKPKAINKDYAMEFVTQSVYSTLFEPMSISTEMREKYTPILSIMPVINTIYKIDREARTIIPISFGKADTLEKTVIRKIKGISQIMRKLSPDERAIVIAEASKVATSLADDKITYQIPEVVCPHCGKVIEAKTVTPLDLLFMRAQLPTIAASIQE